MKCEKIIPDTEKFDSPLTSAALDAGVAVTNALEYCLDNEDKKVAEVATLARDTVDLYIQDRDNLDYQDPDFEEKISNDPLMIAESKKQLDDLETLRKTPELDEDALIKLKGDGRSNIGLNHITVE